VRRADAYYGEQSNCWRLCAKSGISCLKRAMSTAERVTLGWETDEGVDATIEKAISSNGGAWIVQERIRFGGSFPW